jgi:NTP pyrophosphatase (non-canonical NTP hydrolase)
MELNTYQETALQTGVMLVIGEFMHFETYQKQALTTAKMDKTNKWYFALGLAGETGEVVEKIKKFYRDDKENLTQERREGIKKELGDCLWYLSTLAAAFDIKLEDVAQNNLRKLAEREAQNKIHGDGDNR